MMLSGMTHPLIFKSLYDVYVTYLLAILKELRSLAHLVCLFILLEFTFLVKAVIAKAVPPERVTALLQISSEGVFICPLVWHLKIVINIIYI